MLGTRLSLACILALLVLIAGCDNDPYCPEGTSWCWAQCVDLLNDENNCGRCGNACDFGIACVAGECSSRDCDVDGDGYTNVNCPGGDDCDDNDDTVYPGAPEVCDGKDNDCNSEIDEDPNGVICDDGNDCTDDYCNSEIGCINDPAAMAGIECRAAAGLCDAAEFCDGTNVDCPADLVEWATVVCRPAAGVCDINENCDGVNMNCPADAKEPSSTVCRVPAGECDEAETCDGVTADCPVDADLPNGTPCGGAGDSCINGVCEVTITDIVWIQISGGTFMMGSDTGDTDEQPVHQVTVPTFEMAKTEVTVSEYQACVNDGACTAPITGPNCNWGVSGQEDHPVNCVDWQQAVDFCDWAGGRLPSEAEWEYAARSGGQDITYPWGNDSPTCSLANLSGCVALWSTWTVCNSTAGNTTQGLCDMAGNVNEWVQDWYHGSYDCDANPSETGCGSGGIAPTDGSAWESPASTYRVLRGGCFVGSAGNLRVSSRFTGDPTGWAANDGFRCAR